MSNFDWRFTYSPPLLLACTKFPGPGPNSRRPRLYFKMRRISLTAKGTYVPCSPESGSPHHVNFIHHMAGQKYASVNPDANNTQLQRTLAGTYVATMWRPVASHYAHTSTNGQRQAACSCDTIRRRNLNEKYRGSISVVITYNQVGAGVKQVFLWEPCAGFAFCTCTLFIDVVRPGSRCHRYYSSERSFLHPIFCRCCPMR